MESLDQKEVLGTSRITKDLLLYSLTFLGLTSFSLMVLTFQYTRIPEGFVLPSFGTLTLPIFGTFAMGAVVSLLFVRRVTRPMIQKIQHQVHTLGYVEDNQGSLFTNFGFNLILGAFIGASAIGDYLCRKLSLEASPDSFSQFSWHLLKYQVWDYSIGAFIAGIGIGGYLWMLFQVRLVEKETNQKIYIHSYATTAATIWIILITAIVVGIVGYTFFQIVTLGAR